MMQSLYNLNVLDRILAYFAATSTRAVVGETFYQGDNIPHFFFVQATNGSNSNAGTDPRSPVASLETALGFCSANRGDVIFLLPGHTETLTASLTISVAGVTIIGMGNGEKRPQFIVGDAAGEAINITGANVVLDGLILIAGTDQQTWMLGIKALDVTVQNCEFREVLTTKQPLTMLDIGGGGAANTADRAKVLNCYFNAPTAGDGDRAIELGEVMDRVEIGGCVAYGDWDDACIHNPTGKVLTNLYIHDCMLTNLLTGQHSIELVSACTGNLVRNMYHTDITQQTGADPGSCFSFECYQDDVIDTGGILTPVIT